MGYLKDGIFAERVVLPNGDILENGTEGSDGWEFFDEEPKTDYELWEARVDVVKDLKDQAAESPLQLRPYITSWFVGAEALLADFISTGSSDLLDEVTNSPLTWWDMRQDADQPSPREVAIELIEPLS